jgi:hypothetical protein
MRFKHHLIFMKPQNPNQTKTISKSLALNRDIQLNYGEEVPFCDDSSNENIKKDTDLGDFVVLNVLQRWRPFQPTSRRH